MLDINERVDNLLNLIFKSGVWLIAFFLPLLFWNFTSEFYETPKFILLAVVTVLLIVIWLVRFTITGKLNVTRTPLDLPIILMLIVFLISTFFAASRPVAIMGNLPRIHGGLATYIVYALFYLVLVSNLKQIAAVKQVISLLLISGIVLAVLSLSSYAGFNLFFLPWTAGIGFTPTGTSFTTAALLAILLPFPLMSILHTSSTEPLSSTPKAEGNVISSITDNLTGKKIAAKLSMTKLFYTLILSLFTATVVLTGSWVNYLAAAAAFALVLFVAPPMSIKKNIYLVSIPVAVAVVVAFFSFVPVGGSKNILYTQAQSFPREIQLPFDSSWKVAVSAFRDAPFWGTGPASFLFDFTTYKPAEFNATKLWNIRFDQAFNEYLQFLATLGALGLIALLLLTSLFISFASRALTSSQNSLGISLAISGITFFILLALHTSTLTLWVVGMLILASFMTTYKNITKEMSFGGGLSDNNNTAINGLRFDLLPAILLLAAVGLGSLGLYQTGKTVLADYHHRQALNAVARGQGLTAYNELVRAEQLNPYVDLYRTDLAQTNFALANAIASAKGPTEASPAGSLTDEDKTNIQTLLSQAINEGRAATTISPNNAADWEVLGSIYRQISGVAQNALTFSLDSYGRAISHDPLNPMLRLTVGGIYYSVKNYDMATRFFTDAVNLKPDFANAYYNLAVVLRDNNDLASAVASAERTVSLLDPASADYKTAADLLSNLKDRLASEAAKQQAAGGTNQQGAPAAQTNSALQNSNLPKVLDLPKPENVATPAAVKKQGQGQAQAQPTPTPTPVPQP